MYVARLSQLADPRTPSKIIARSHEFRLLNSLSFGLACCHGFTLAQNPIAEFTNRFLAYFWPTNLPTVSALVTSRSLLHVAAFGR